MPDSGSGPVVSEAMVAAAAQAISGSFDVIPEGEEPFVGWSSLLAERALEAALSVDRERDRLVEEVRRDLRTLLDSHPRGDNGCPLCGAKSVCHYCEPKTDARARLVRFAQGEALSSSPTEER